MELTDAVLSLDSNFWWEPVMQELYLDIGTSVIACCYHFVDGCCLFLSDKTHATIPYADLVTNEGAKAKLKLVINFESFIEEHKGVNIRLLLKRITIKVLSNPQMLDTTALRRLETYGHLSNSYKGLLGVIILQISKQKSAQHNRIIYHQRWILVNLN